MVGSTNSMAFLHCFPAYALAAVPVIRNLQVLSEAVLLPGHAPLKRLYIYAEWLLCSPRLKIWTVKNPINYDIAAKWFSRLSRRISVTKHKVFFRVSGSTPTKTDMRLNSTHGVSVTDP